MLTRTSMVSNGILIACVILTALVGCRSERTATVPDDLIGVWKTTEPRYADRPFEFTRNTVSIQVLLLLRPSKWRSNTVEESKGYGVDETEE
jgi:hypothetical protein